MARTTITKDSVKKLTDKVRALTKTEILVGIPAATAPRPDGEINNAQLGYIHEFGSPAAHIPARPFLIPGVQSVLPQIEAGLKKAGELALVEDAPAVEQQLHAIGLLAQNAVRRKITLGPFVPLALSTIAERLRKRHPGKTMADVTAGNVVIRPLIDSGRLRASLSYVLRKVR